MNFKEYTTILKEAKFREVTPQLMAQVKRIAKLYDEKYRVEEDRETLEFMEEEGIIRRLSDLPEWKTIYFDQLKSDMKAPKYFAPNITKVTVEDLQTGKSKQVDILIIYGNVTDDYASYIETFETVNLFNKNIYMLPTQRIESLILHELTHSFQQYKKVSKDYEENVSKSSKDFDEEKYYLEPIELDSHLNEIGFTIRKKHKTLKEGVKKAKDPAAKRVLQNRLDLFLQELKVFTKTPLEAYLDLKELELPTYLKDFEEFLKIIKSKTQYWQKFKNKMLGLYNELINTGSKENL